MIINDKVLPLEARMDFYRTMAQYEADGKSILQMLRNKAQRAMVKKTPYGKQIIEIHRRMDESGMGIAQSLEPYIPRDEFLFLKLAEIRSNSVGDMLKAVVGMTTKKIELKTRVIKASFMPVMVFIVAHILVMVLIYAVFPQIYSLIEGVKLDGVNNFVINSLIPFLQISFIPIALIFIGTVFLLIVSLPFLVRKPIRPILDRMVFINKLYREYIAANILMTMGASLKTGTTLIDFYRTYSSVSLPYLSILCERILERLQNGSYSPAQSLDIGLFDPQDMEKLYDYTDTGGSIAESLSKIGDAAVNVSITRIERKLKSVFFKMLAVIFLLLGGFIVVMVNAGKLAMQNNSF